MKMFIAIITVAIIAQVNTAPQISNVRSAMAIPRSSLPAIIHEDIHDPSGQFTLRYETAEGTIVSQRGQLVPNHDGTGQVLVYEGDYTFVGPDGKTYVTKYKSGPNGVEAEGEHLPVPVVA